MASSWGSDRWLLPVDAWWSGRLGVAMMGKFSAVDTGHTISPIGDCMAIGGGLCIGRGQDLVSMCEEIRG